MGEPMTPQDINSAYERAYSLAWHETVRGETVGQTHERAIRAGIAAVAAAAERAGMLRAAGIVDALDVYPRCDIESMYRSDGYREAADAIRRAAGGAE